MSELSLVMSGLAYTRFSTSRYDRMQDVNRIQKIVHGAFDKVDGYQVDGLFNAFTEKSIVEVLPRFKFNEIHVDSGGLQVALLGKTMTPEIKKDIYTTQGKHGDIAMCIDNIPLFTKQVDKASSGSQRTRTDNKIFLTAELQERARDTGKNVNEQLKVFRDIGSKAKVMLIAQGNQPQDFADFIRFQYDEIDEDLRDGIKGIALADTCIGNGVLESIDMLHGFKLIDIPEKYKKHIHLLGVGSISRMMPVLEMIRSGFLEDDIHISFDSTTQTSSYVMGKLISEEGQTLKLGKAITPENIAFFTNIYNEYILDEYGDEHREDYVKMMTNNLRGSKHIHNENLIGDMAFVTYFLAPFHQVRIFMRSLLSCQENFRNYSKYISNKHLILAMSHLNKVTTIDELETYKHNFTKYIGSNRIARGKSKDEIVDNDLHALFA